MPRREVSAEVLSACEAWHGGQWTAMYSILSLGYVYDADMADRAVSEFSHAMATAEHMRGLSDDEVTELADAATEIEQIARHLNEEA